MNVKKLGHACLELTKDDETIVVDPGRYTDPIEVGTGVLAVVITHAHDDHCYEAQLDRIIAVNPDVVIYGTDEVCRRLANYNTVAVHHGDFYQVGSFTIEFFGDMHQEIHRSIPLIQNCGVMIDGKLYYPGDSYTQPDREVELLACPTSAPWLKIGDVMDFLAAVRPKRSFATHNALLSDKGHELNNSRVQMVTEQFGGTFEYLEVGQSTTL